jgi:hypothetical protein
VSVIATLACSNKSICPYPNASGVDVNPATPCLDGHVDTCIDPTLVVKNNCAVPLYLPTAYGHFGPDAAPGDDIEVLPSQTVHYVLKPEKAVASPGKKDFTIPARLTTQPIEIRFSTSNGG